MADLDPDKALAALEAEQERRLQAKIDSGELVSQTITVVCTRDEDVEEATARALAGHPAPDDGRAIHREFFYVFTGAPVTRTSGSGSSLHKYNLPRKGLPIPLTRLSRLGVAGSHLLPHPPSRPMCR